MGASGVAKLFLPAANAISSWLPHWLCRGACSGCKLVPALGHDNNLAWVSLPNELSSAAVPECTGPPRCRGKIGRHMPLAGHSARHIEQGLPGWCRLCRRCCQPACTMRSCAQPAPPLSRQRPPRPPRWSPRWRPGCWPACGACRSSRRPARRRRLSCTAVSSTLPAPSAAS